MGMLSVIFGSFALSGCSVKPSVGPRGADGSLSYNGFARLKEPSPFYGKSMGLI